MEAVRLLLQRIAAVVAPETYTDIRRPHHLPRTRARKGPELRKSLIGVLADNPDCTGIVMIFDADDDCPVELAHSLHRMAATVRGNRSVSVVAPVREYEAWFLASAPSLAGYKGLPSDLQAPGHPEAFKSPKGWLSARMPKTSPYKPRTHQAAFTMKMDLQMARDHAPSFDKLCRDVQRMVTVAR